MESKAIWLSKTFWLNVLAVVALIVQSQFGFVISPELQASLLMILNVILRLVTKTEVTWK